MNRRKVTDARLVSVRGSVLGSTEDPRRIRQWDLTLECGHIVERRGRYTRSGGSRANGWHPRPKTDLLPAPKSAHCEYCPSACPQCGEPEPLFFAGQTDEPNILQCPDCGWETVLS